MKSKTKRWALAAGIRAIKTFAQTLISMLTIGQAFVDINWVHVLSVSGVAALVSLLTSVAGLPEVDDDDITFEESTVEENIIEEEE